jgi:hypothetical protein
MSTETASDETLQPIAAAPPSAVPTSVSPSPTRFKPWRSELGYQIPTLLAVALLWCVYYNKWPGSHGFGVPTAYIDRGDTLYILGVAKAFSELPSPWNLHIERLNAPFGADWNDYPQSEKLLYYSLGLLGRFFEVGVAVNVALLAVHLIAAICFAWTARRLRVSAPVAVAGGILYSFSPFLLGRALPHLNISTVWHIPLVVYLVYRLATSESTPARRIQIGAALLMAATSLLNPYYAALAIQLVLLATLRAWLQRRAAVARLGMALAAVGVGVFFAGQVNVFIRTLRAGANATFSGRSLGAVMNWGLRLPDLFLPRNHPIEPWVEFAESHYFQAGNPGSENGFAFLGFVGCGVLLAIVAWTIVCLLRERFDAVPWEAWLLVYTVFFAIAGGGNYLLAALGMNWLRAANRYSIVILCLVLLWGCRMAGSWRSPLVRNGVVYALVTLSVLEFFFRRPRDTADGDLKTAATCASDARFAHELEASLPAGGAVFQLPVAHFPESPSIESMHDYEQFRPYIWSNSLRFSYGTHKGREREDWQTFAANLSPAELLKYLGEHGFDAVLLNRRGFADRGVALEKALGEHSEQIAGGGSGDLVAFRVKHTGDTLPQEYSPITLDSGFPWGWEHGSGGRWAWSNGSAQLRVLKRGRRGQRYEFSASLETLSARQVTVFVNERRVGQFKLKPQQVSPVNFSWVPGLDDVVRFETDVPVQRPTNGDPRTLGFRVINPVMQEVGARRK